MTGRPPGPDDLRDVSDDFDDVARITEAVKRLFVAGLVALPVWLLLLLAFGRLFGIGIGSFLLASFLALIPAWWWLRRSGGVRGGKDPGPHPGLGIPRIAWVISAAVIVLYLLLALAVRPR